MKLAKDNPSSFKNRYRKLKKQGLTSVRNIYQKLKQPFPSLHLRLGILQPG